MPNVVIKWIVDDSQLTKSRSHTIEAQKATDDLRKSTKAYGDEVKNTSTVAVKGFSDLKSIVASISLISLITGLGAIAKKIFDIGVANQQTKISFEVMLGSAEKAKRMLAELTRFSIITPFTPDQVNKAAKALLAFDVEAKKIIPTLKFLGDVSSGTGKDLAEMAIIFGQIRSSGRLMGQDLLQLINAGFNPLQVIAKETGKSMGQLKVEMEKGLISFDMVEHAFISATSEGGRFFNLMEKQSVTIGGQLSTIEGNIEEISKKLFEARQGGLASFVSGIAELSGNIDGIAKALNDWIDLALFAPNLAVKGMTAIKDTTKEAADETKRLRNEYLELQLAMAKGDLETNTETGLGNRLKIIQRIFDLEKQLGIVKITPIEDPVEGPSKGEGPASIGLVEALRKKIHELGLEIEKTTERGDLGGTGKLVVQLKQAQDQLDILLGKHKDKRKKDANEVQEYLAYLSDLEMFQTKQTLTDETQFRKEELEKQTSIEKTSFEHWKYYDDLKREKQRETAEEAIKIAEDEAAKKQRLDRETAQLAMQLFENTLRLAFTSRDEDIDGLEDYYDKQIELAGDNDRRKKEIEIQRERDLDAARERQKRAEQKAAEVRILIDGLMAIAKIFSEFGYPAGIIPAALMAGITATNVAQVRKYKEGEINIKGPGTETSDSIPAMISKGESVMTAKQTREAFGILTDVRAGKLNDRVLKQIVANGGSQSFSDERMVNILEKIEAKRSPDIVRQGRQIFEVYIDRDGNKKRIRSKSM